MIAVSAALAVQRRCRFAIIQRGAHTRAEGPGRQDLVALSGALPDDGAGVPAAPPVFSGR